MLTFDESTHTYRIDGEVVPSVTQVCRFLNYDIKSDRPWLEREAADRGTRIHAATAAIDWGEEPEEEPDTAGYIKAYRRFLQDYKPEWEGVELSLGTNGKEDIPFAGTIDRFGTINGEQVVLDIKTGSKVNLPYVDAQLCAYTLLLWHNDIVEFPDWPKRVCLKLSKDGTYQYLPTEAEERDSLFNYCLMLHQALSTKGAYKA